MSPPLPVQIIERVEDAAAALTPLRLDLLRRLAEPASAASLARDVGLSRQVLNYHLKALQTAGLVDAVEQRKKGNCTETVLQARARTYVVGPSALGEVGADPSRVQDRFSWGYLIAVCSRAIKDLATLRRRAGAERKELATLTMKTEVRFRSPEDRTAFANELATAFATIAARYHAPDAEDGRSFTAFVCAHPSLPADDAGDDPTPEQR